MRRDLKAVEKVTRDNLTEYIAQNVDPSVVLMTDENPTYTLPGRLLAGHGTVEHHRGEYARGEDHINTAEGYFSQLKRSIDGTHDFVSRRHLQRYVTEFDHRYNTRELSDGSRMVGAIGRTRGKRLKYESGVKAQRSQA